MRLKPASYPAARGSNLSLANQAGSMLISVLFIMVVLGALMAAMVTVSDQSSQQLVYEVQALKTRLVAESALEKEIYKQLITLTSHDTESELQGCKVRTRSHTLGMKQVNIITTGECDSGQLTVVRNIEAEVLGNEN